MSATTYFIHGTGEDNTIGAVDGSMNAMRASSFLLGNNNQMLPVSKCLELISLFPDKDFVSEDLVKELKELPSDEKVGVSIDF